MSIFQINWCRTKLFTACVTIYHSPAILPSSRRIQGGFRTLNLAFPFLWLAIRDHSTHNWIKFAVYKVRRDVRRIQLIDILQLEIDGQPRFHLMPSFTIRAKTVAHEFSFRRNVRRKMDIRNFPGYLRDRRRASSPVFPLSILFFVACY